METIPIDMITLSSGPHDTREGGVCLMEAVAWWQGEEHSDRPECTCPVLATFARRVNDITWPGDLRNRLLVVLPDLVGTVAPIEVMVERAHFFARWAQRLAGAPIANRTAIDYAANNARAAAAAAAAAANLFDATRDAIDAASFAADVADARVADARVAVARVAPLMTECIAAIRGAAAIGRTTPKLPMPTELVGADS